MVCRHISFHCASLYSIFFFFPQIEGLWQLGIVRWWLAFLSNDVLFFFFKRSCYCILNSLPSSVDITFILIGKPKNPRGLLYRGIRFTAVVCKWTYSASESACTLLSTLFASFPPTFPQPLHFSFGAITLLKLLLLGSKATSCFWNSVDTFSLLPLDGIITPFFLCVCGSPISPTASFQFILLNPIPPPLLIILESARVLSF